MGTAVERTDDLQLKGLKICQDTEAFCFGTDAVLLSAFVKAKAGESVLDIGCGNGIIELLLSAKCDADRITGVEIQPAAAALARRNVAMNGLESRIDIIEGDIRREQKKIRPGSYSVVVSNPPYIKAGSGLCGRDARSIARHEITITLEEMLRAAGKLLIAGGRFYMVHRPQRLVEILSEMRKALIEPKKVRFVHACAGKEATLVLIEGAKEGRPDMTVLPPLILHEADGRYTAEAEEIYGIKETS